MKVIATEIEGPLIIEPDVYRDQRGFFMETYHIERYRNCGIDSRFVQDNVSRSVKGVLRGLHYQIAHPQAKLVQVLEGEIYDVAVDLRQDSPAFGKWVGVTLSGRNLRQFFIPEGFAHGFCVTSETVLFSYKCGDFYFPEDEGGILWSDPSLGIDWPIERPVLSDRDRNQPLLKDVPPHRFPNLSSGDEGDGRP
jgi:dTDP-4-dehydrorhamnose 3,5-epimerase